MSMTATYSPDDNKLRLYASSRLDPDLYARVRAHGFIWAPKQDLFVAPMWTPQRADLLIDLCGEIDDEDTSLTERAEERAERFDEYHEHRKADAESAHNAVAKIADGIPLGQPILVGHHSERHARKDAERIENGMRRAIKMWDTAEYWKRRAAGALYHAKHKERPDVRARRIKGIEADRRKRTKEVERSHSLLNMWGKPLDTPMKDGSISPRHRVIALANMDGGGWTSLHHYRLRDETGREYGDVYHTGPASLWEAAGGNIRDYDPDVCALATPEEIRDKAIQNHHRIIAWAERWIAHYDNRLTYERAMLAEAGGIITDRTEHPIQVGGRVLIGGEWMLVLRVNRKDGAIVSVTTNARYVGVRGIETVKDYRPPTAEDCVAVDARMKLPPLCNYPTEGSIEMTKADFKAKSRQSDFGYITTIEGTETAGKHRRRRVPALNWKWTPVYLTDEKRKDPPPPNTTPLPPLRRIVDEAAPLRKPPIEERDTDTQMTRATVDELRDALKAGVQVVSAPQLFPTPPDLARRIVDLADIRSGHLVLEPSAGTGAIIRAIPTFGIHLTAVEINHSLAGALDRGVAHKVICADFLTCNGNLGTFDRIVMNPPFVNAADVQHILHARKFLKPGGRLVAICANGPRQRAALEPIALDWIDLPAGSFADSGTNVNAAIVLLDAEAD